MSSPEPKPKRKPFDKEHIEDLIRRGILKRPKREGPLPPEFFTRPLPKAKGSVVEQLLEDRHSDD